MSEIMKAKKIVRSFYDSKTYFAGRVKTSEVIWAEGLLKKHKSKPKLSPAEYKKQYYQQNKKKMIKAERQRREAQHAGIYVPQRADREIGGKLKLLVQSLPEQGYERLLDLLSENKKRDKRTEVIERFRAGQDYKEIMQYTGLIRIYFTTYCRRLHEDLKRILHL